MILISAAIVCAQDSESSYQPANALIFTNYIGDIMDGVVRRYQKNGIMPILDSALQSSGTRVVAYQSPLVLPNDAIHIHSRYGRIFRYFIFSSVPDVRYITNQQGNLASSPRIAWDYYFSIISEGYDVQEEEPAANEYFRKTFDTSIYKVTYRALYENTVYYFQLDVSIRDFSDVGVSLNFSGNEDIDIASFTNLLGNSLDNAEQYFLSEAVRGDKVNIFDKQYVMYPVNVTMSNQYVYIYAESNVVYLLRFEHRYDITNADYASEWKKYYKKNLRLPLNEDPIAYSYEKESYINDLGRYMARLAVSQFYDEREVVTLDITDPRLQQDSLMFSEVVSALRKMIGMNKSKAVSLIRRLKYSAEVPGNETVISTSVDGVAGEIIIIFKNNKCSSSKIVLTAENRTAANEMLTVYYNQMWDVLGSEPLRIEENDIVSYYWQLEEQNIILTTEQIDDCFHVLIVFNKITN